MTLQDLVTLRNRLQSCIHTGEITAAINALVANVDSIASTPTEYTGRFSELAQHYRELGKLFATTPSLLLEAIANVNSAIDAATAGYHRRGYRINGHIACNPTDVNGERTLRMIAAEPELKKLVLARIDLYASWRYPGLEIGPGDGQWTHAMVAADPLYLVDVHQEFLTKTSSQFTAGYQRRLSPYLIDATTNDLQALPDSQLGFVFAWNVFDYFPELELRHYLSQLITKMRPGATILFSYNNCDNPVQAGFADRGWKSWMPKTKLAAMLAALGFVDAEFFEFESHVSFVEAKKPGELTTIKAHQVMGEIKSRNS